jgi:diketogulonate reductase-like aldo/keto reductase
MGRAIVITTSSRKDRLERYLAVGDIYLTEEDVEAIDRAGKKGERDEKRKEKVVKAVKYAALGGVGLWALARLAL